MNASDLFEVGRYRLVHVEIGVRVQEHQGHVPEQRLGVRMVAPETVPSRGRSAGVRVPRVRRDGRVVRGVPEALQERPRDGVRRVQRGHVRRVGRAVERALVPREHLAGHDSHVRRAQVRGQVQVAAGRQQLGDHQFVGTSSQQTTQVRVLERHAASLPVHVVQKIVTARRRLVSADHLSNDYYYYS